MTVIVDPAFGWLGLTLAVEVMLALVLRRVVGSRETGDLVIAVVGVNLVSFSVALLAASEGLHWRVTEAGVVVAEAALYRAVLGRDVGRPILLAVATNVPTAAFGALVSW